MTISFKQPIAYKDALRTGSYAKTLTFTLSTTNPVTVQLVAALRVDQPPRGRSLTCS